MAETPKRAVTMRPYDARFADLIRMKSDNYTYGKTWILTDGFQVSVTEQKIGEAPTQQISLPRHQFNKLIDWYMRHQKLPRPSKPRRAKRG